MDNKNKEKWMHPEKLEVRLIDAKMKKLLSLIESIKSITLTTIFRSVSNISNTCKIKIFKYQKDQKHFPRITVKRIRNMIQIKQLTGGISGWLTSDGSTPLVIGFTQTSADVVDLCIPALLQELLRSEKNYLRIQVGCKEYMYGLRSL